MTYIPVTEIPANFAAEIAEKIGAVRGAELPDLLPKGAKLPEGYTLVSIEAAHDKLDIAAEVAKDKLGRVTLKMGFGGVILGAGLGVAAGYWIGLRRLETKYNQIAEDEIAEMREHYQAKGVALENTVAKPHLEDVVRDQGYSQEPPMAVTPPSTVFTDTEKKIAEEDAQVREENVFERPPVTPEEAGTPLIDRDWNYQRELVNRSPIKPYIIHRDEKDEHEGVYDTVTFTYYEEDDVLCNERDEVIGKEERDPLIGEANLSKFGHGSGDENVVFIRNDRLEMQMEVVLSPNSFAEEVHGFQHSENDAWRHRRERSSPDDE